MSTADGWTGAYRDEQAREEAVADEALAMAEPVTRMVELPCLCGDLECMRYPVYLVYCD